VLLILGHAILISLTVLLVRKRAFEAKFKGVSDERERERSTRRSSAVELQVVDRESTQRSTGTDIPRESTEGQSSDPRPKTSVLVREAPGEPSCCVEHCWIDDDQITVGGTPSRLHHHHRVFPMAGIGARPDLNNHPRDAAPSVPLFAEDSVSGFMGILRGTQKYMASKGLVSRNSQFHDLTAAEREELGGVEYKAVSFLSVVVFLYLILFIVFGVIGVGCWLEANDPAVTRTNGLSPFWTGAFFAVSAFVNSGMSLLDANMTALQLRWVDEIGIQRTNLLTCLRAYPLLTMGLLILAGNTLFPCFLRFIIWTMRKMLPNRPAWQSWRITLDFILEHPRRVSCIISVNCRISKLIMHPGLHKSLPCSPYLVPTRHDYYSERYRLGSIRAAIHWKQGH
jgi:hypothetical protein